MTTRKVSASELPRLRTRLDAAKYLGVGRATISSLIDAGEIHATHIASRIFISEDELRRIVREGVGARRKRPERSTSGKGARAR